MLPKIDVSRETNTVEARHTTTQIVLLPLRSSSIFQKDFLQIPVKWSPNDAEKGTIKTTSHELDFFYFVFSSAIQYFHCLRVCPIDRYTDVTSVIR